MKGIKTLAVLVCIAAITIAATDASAYLHPRLGRFMQRDPKGYVDGMSLYEYVNSRPTRYVDPQGTWKRSANRYDFSYRNGHKKHQWCAQAGDSLQTLAAKAEYGGNAENWRCLWPMEGTKDHGYTKGRVQPGDMYDASNLTQRGWGPMVHINMDTDDKEYARVRGAAFKATTGTAVYDVIKKSSKQGASPISDFEFNGHCDDWPGMTAGGPLEGRDDFWPKRYPPNYPIPTFARAQKRQGPHRCWFRRNARGRALLCGGLSFGKAFAASFLRRGASIKTTGTGVETGSSRPWFCETRFYFKFPGTNKPITWYESFDDYLKSPHWVETKGAL